MMKGPTHVQPPTLQAKMKLKFSFSCKVGLDLTLDKDFEIQPHAFGEYGFKILLCLHFSGLYLVC